MPSAEKDGDRIWVDTEIWQADDVRQVPGARRKAERWTVPLSWPSCLVLRSVFGDDLEVGPDLAKWSRAEVRNRVHPAMVLRDQLEFPGDAELFPHVRAGIQFLTSAGDALLLDDFGGGKTVQSLRAAVELPVLVVVPPSVIWKWAEETAHWRPDLRVSVVHGAAGARRKALEVDADLYIIGWQNLIKHSRLASYGSHALTEAEKTPKELNIREWGTVIADEVHRAKNPKAKWTRALWAIGDKARRRWGLSGTPVDDRSGDNWALFRFIAPYEWPDHQRAVDRWYKTGWSGWGYEVRGLNPATMTEYRKATSPRWRRVPASVYRGERPEPLHRPPVLLDLPPRQRKMYDQMKKGLIADAAGGGQLVAWDPLSQVLRLWQLASACTDEQGKLIEPSVKVDALLDLMQDTDEPLVVFAAHRQLIELVAAKLEPGTYGLVTGAVDPRDRHSYIQRFQAGELRTMLCTYGAGDEGIELTRGRILVRLQHSWSNKQNTQAVGRLDRPGQTGAVEVISFQGRKTIDQVVPRVAALKGKRLEEFVQDRQQLVRLLSQETEEA